MLPIVENAILRLNPVHVLDTIDNLVSKMKIEEAVRLLTFFVARSPYTKTPVILMNRFIRLIQVNISNLFQFSVLRREINEIFLSRAILELEGYSNKLSIDSIKFDYVSKSPLKQFEWDRKEKLPKSLPEEPTNSNYERFDYFSGKKYFESLILFAYFLYKDAKYENAYEICKFIIEKDKNHYLAYWLMGVLNHYYFKNFQGMIMNYTNSIKCEPEFAYSRYSLGVSYHDHELGEDLAQCLFNQTLKIDPKHIYCLINLSNFKDRKEAIKLCIQAISIDPYDITACNIMMYRFFEDDLLTNVSNQLIGEIIQILHNNIKILIIENKLGDRISLLAKKLLDLAFMYRKYEIDIKKKLFKEHECLVKYVELTEADEFSYFYDEIYHIELEILELPENDLPLDFRFIAL
jgi:tetratricopeptide (TPR) repeat protein